MDIILYVFLLENNKFILHPSTLEYKENLFTELGMLYDFTNINKPIKIIETYYIFDVTEIDKHVKNYMLNNGIENVRGGSYIETDLPEYKLKALESELKLNKNDFMKRSEMIHAIIEKYKDMGEEAKNLEKNELTKQLESYNKTKDDFSYYGTLLTKPKIEKIDRKLLFRFEWLNDYIAYSNFSEGLPCKETREIYKHTMLLLTKLSKLFFERFPDYEFTPMLNYTRPDVVFDSIFLHKQYFNNWENLLETANEVYKKYEFMYYKMLNNLDELEFDISMFPDNFEDECILSIKYLDTCL